MARVPQKRTPRRFTQPPRPFDTRQVVSPFSQALETAVAVRDVVDQGLKDQGAEAGAKAVSRDEDGNISVDEPGFFGRMLPEYSAARENAALAAYLAESENDIRKKLSELREQTPTDANAFNESGMAFARQMRDSAQAGFGPQVFQLATREVQRVSRGIQRRAERLELQRQEGALLASIGEKENELLALARQGGTDTEEFVELSASYRDQLGVLVNNPLFAFSQEEADVRIRNLTGRARLEASSREVLGVYGAQGELAALNHARTIADNMPGLTEREREEWVADQRILINERESARSKAEANLKRLNARRIDDAVATLAAGNDASGILNDPKLMTGFDEVERQLIQEELTAAKRAGQAKKAMLGAAPDERAAIIDSFAVEGPGARLTARYRASLESENAAIARRLRKDPVGLVAQSNPELVENLGTALQEGDPEAFAESAASLIEEQERLGALNPRILSVRQRKAMTARLLGDEGDENRVQNLADEIDRLSAVAGEHFPRIMAELIDEEDFPAAAYGIGLVEGNEHAQFLLAKAAVEDPKVLRENVGKLGTGAVDDLRDDLAGRAEPLVSSLAASGWSQTRIDKVTDAMEALASQFAVEKGKVGGAAKKAFDTMFGNYHFEGTYRVPPQHDPDDVRIGVDAFEERFQPDDFIVPNPPANMRREDAQRSYLSHLKSFGRWVTTPDETGLMLVDGEGRPVMERPINAGDPPETFAVSFEQFAAFARERRKENVEKAAEARRRAMGHR